MSDTPAPRRQVHRLILLLEYVLVFGVTVAVISRVSRGELGAHVDTVHHLLAAEDCLTGDACHLRLSPRGGASVLGVFHGAAFVHILVFVQWLGGDLASVRLALAALTALAAVLLYALVRKETGAVAGFLLAAVFVAWAGREHSGLWNPTLSPLPAVLFLAFACVFVRDRRFGVLLLAAATAGIAIQVHLAAGALLVPLVMLIGLLPRERRLGGALVTGAVVLGTVQIVSPAMIVDADWSRLARLLPPWPLLLVGGLGFGAWVGFIVQRARARSPLWWLVAGSYAPIFAVAFVVAPGDIRYWLSLVPGVLLLTGMAMGTAGRLVRGPGERWFASHPWAPRWAPRWAARGAAVCGAWAAFASLPGQPLADGFPLGDCERIARRLQSEGLTYEDVRGRLRGGTEANDVLRGLGLYFPATTGPRAVRPSVGGGPELAIFRPLRLPHGLPSGVWSYFPLERGRTVLVQRQRSWLEWDEAEECTAWDGHESRELRRVRRALPPALQPLLAQRDFPLVGDLAWPKRYPARLVVRIPVRIPADSGERIVVVPSAAEGPRLPCDGRIEDVEGLDFEGALPSIRIRLRAVEAPQNGALLLRWDFRERACHRSSDFPARLPPVNEFLAGEMHVLETILPSWELGADAAPSAGSDRLKLSDFTRGGPVRGVPRYDDRPEPTVPRAYVIGVSLVLACAAIAATGALLSILSRDQADTT